PLPRCAARAVAQRASAARPIEDEWRLRARAAHAQLEFVPAVPRVRAPIRRRGVRTRWLRRATHRRSSHARASAHEPGARRVSEAPSDPPRRADWWARPRVVLPIVAALVVLVALLTPQPDSGRTGDQRLSSHLAGALGARLLYETADRLGWHVSQRDTEG